MIVNKVGNQLEKMRSKIVGVNEWISGLFDKAVHSYKENMEEEEMEEEAEDAKEAEKAMKAN